MAVLVYPLVMNVYMLICLYMVLPIPSVCGGVRGLVGRSFDCLLGTGATFQCCSCTCMKSSANVIQYSSQCLHKHQGFADDALTNC